VMEMVLLDCWRWKPRCMYVLVIFINFKIHTV
jgi:hypothetical protein